jgi:hypothetical protein
MQTPANTPQSIQRIGFLGYREFENGDAFRGGILVADEWSKPLEFRCTAPVRPTPLQRTLYGKSLLPHILAELIGEPVINSLREKPQIILSSVEGFFDLRHKLSVPLLAVRSLDSKADSEKKSEREPPKTVILQSGSGKFGKVEVRAHWKFPADLDGNVEALRDFYGRWDLVEPFNRVHEGLQFVHDEHVLES